MASRIQEITVEIGGDTTKLQNALKGVNGQIKSMKIHIIGCSGSGKTYLANALSKKYNISHFDFSDRYLSSNNGAVQQAGYLVYG